MSESRYRVLVEGSDWEVEGPPDDPTDPRKWVTWADGVAPDEATARDIAALVVARLKGLECANAETFVKTALRNGMLQAERDALRAELEALREAAWGVMTYGCTTKGCRCQWTTLRAMLTPEVK